MKRRKNRDKPLERQLEGGKNKEKRIRRNSPKCILGGEHKFVQHTHGKRKDLVCACGLHHKAG